jgi:hypothetical protein
MLRADLLALAADDADLTHLKYTHLSFKNLGFEETLPFVFSLLRVEVSYNGMEMTAFARTPSPAMVGRSGD